MQSPGCSTTQHKNAQLIVKSLKNAKINVYPYLVLQVYALNSVAPHSKMFYSMLC